MSKLTFVFAAVAVMMLSDLCSASENLPGQNLEEVKRSWFPEEDKRSWFPEDYKRSSYPLFHKRYVAKRSWFPEDYKRSSWYPLFHKRSEDDQQNLEEVKRPGGHFWVGKRSIFGPPNGNIFERYDEVFQNHGKRASWYPLFHKRSEDEQTPDLAHSEKAKRYYYYY